MTKPVYGPDDAPATRPPPGEFPFTRGVRPEGYRGRPWTMRQYAGFSSAEETNRRFRLLLERGQTWLSVAFDLPTQLGLDSDHPLALGEVGRTGVAIDSLADMERLLEGIPLADVSTSMTINAPGSLLLLLYELVGERQGVAAERLSGTIQNDILKEYIARGNYIFPARPSMRLTVDTFRYCTQRLPRWNTISISGYHIREAGSTAAQELAFTLANGIAYVQAAVDAGLEVDAFARRLSFFFNAHNNFFQEVAKFRAARALWAEIMRDRFGARDERSAMLRFHAQTGGSTLTAQQAENNIVRVAVQAFSAVCGGAQSLHTNGFDEALALPTERSATIALRTQQVLATEAGSTDTADPLAASQPRRLGAGPDPSGASAQGVVRAPLVAQHLAHLADRGIGAEGRAHRHEQVRLAGGGGAHLGQGRLHLARVARGPQRGGALALAPLGLGIDPVQLDRRLALGRVAIDADDHLLARLHPLVVGERGLLDLILHPSGVDGGDRAAQLVDGVDQLPGLVGERVRQRLDVVAARQRIRRVDRAGLGGQDLLGAKRDRGAVLRRQGEGLVERVRVQALG